MLTLVELCEMGALELVVSAAHEIENAQNLHPERRTHTDYVLSLARHRVLATPEIAGRTATYAQAGLNRLDAFHLAAAVIA